MKSHELLWRHREYILDANILFRFLISGRELYLQFLTDNKIFTPDFALEEIQNYQDVIGQRTKLSPGQFQTYTLTLFSRIPVVPNLLVTTQHYYQVYALCNDIDLKDIPYVALSLQLGVTLLTDDKPLVNGLRQKGFSNIIALEELFKQSDDIDLTNEHP